MLLLNAPIWCLGLPLLNMLTSRNGHHEECTTEPKHEVACEVWTWWFTNQVVLTGLLGCYLFVNEAI